MPKEEKLYDNIPATRRDSDYMSACGIGEKYHKMVWADFTNDDTAKYRIRQYLALVPEMLQEGIGLYLYGANGTGKTLSMSLAFKALMKKGYVVRIITMSEFVTMFTGSWYNDDARHAFEDILRKVHFLGIEEMAKEFRSEKTDLALVALDHVIRTRLQSNKPTWITSNMPPSSISGSYSVDVASMLREACIPIKVAGKDYREVLLDRNINSLK